MYLKRIWSIEFLQGYLKTIVETTQHTYIKKKTDGIIKTYEISWLGIGPFILKFKLSF